MPDTTTPYRQQEFLRYMYVREQEGYTIAELKGRSGVTTSAARAALKRMRNMGYVFCLDGKWYLTASGISRAAELINF